MRIQDIINESEVGEQELRSAIDEFMKFAFEKLHINPPYPELDLSYDQEEAQELHRTGSYEMDSNVMTIYVRNRNLVDILRTVCHELVHKRQHERNMIDAGQNHPGSEIEQQADAVAGYLMKLYAIKHREIFQ
jgi:hypothetical protein